MRREFTAISAFSMVIALMAGVVLCMQIAHMKLTPGWEISPLAVWALEAVIFGTAVCAWRPGISLAGWVVGIVGLVLARLALSALAGLALGVMRGEVGEAAALQETSALAPRMCAVIFALMVCYPLRVFLPLRPVRASRGERRFADSPVAQPGVDASRRPDSEMVILAGRMQGREPGSEEARGAGRMTDVPRPRVELDGTVELRVRAVMNQMPQELLKEKARGIDDSQMMSIPLEAILPQLREGRIVFSPAQIREWLPAGARRAVVEVEERDQEAVSVTLPLELSVPQLPPEALALPAPSPPEWAKEDESDRVVFARI